MTPDREYELLARIEQLKDEIEASNNEREELRYRLSESHKHIRRLIQERDVAEDRLRAAQSQGAV